MAKKTINDESSINASARAYMAECMGMTTPYEDQEQNFILGHMATFAHRLQRRIDALTQERDRYREALTKVQAHFNSCFSCQQRGCCEEVEEVVMRALRSAPASAPREEEPR